MDTVVYLALFVLGAVFVVSLIVLLAMCKRRRFRLKHLRQNPRFSKLHNDSLDGIVQLTPLLAMALERNGWVYDVGGLLQHCVAVLQLAHSLSEQLATQSMAQSSPQLQHLVSEATHRVMPRFDDLLSSVASPKVDVRILEARASALATVCWSLAMPFTLAHPNMKEKLAEPLQSMEQHLEALSAAARLAEQSDTGKVDIDWKTCGQGPEGDDEGTSGIHPSPSPSSPPPRQSAAHITQTALPPHVSSAAPPASEAAPTTTICITETAPLLERLRENDAASPNGHPADPVA
ncbi:unnamed protein product, partial [Mesorhabditis spiculigera]